jgi:TadE-like protein
MNQLGPSAPMNREAKKRNVMARPMKVSPTLAGILGCERGSPSIEFALLVPLLLIFLTGIIDGGFIFYVQNAMEEASRAAARAYSVDPSTDVTAVAGNLLPVLVEGFEIKKSVDANGLAIVEIKCPAGNATLIGFVDAFHSLSLAARTGIPKEW